jgi:hypothetical protein
MIETILDDNYTGFAYVKDGMLKNYIPIACREWYWVYVKKGRVRNSYVSEIHTGKLVPRGSKVTVCRYANRDDVWAYHRIAHRDTDLFRYDGNSLTLWFRLTWRNLLNRFYYYAPSV